MTIKLEAAAVHAYGVLADVHHNWPSRHTKEGQALLADLRDGIAETYGKDPEYVQNVGGYSPLVRNALGVKV